MVVQRSYGNHPHYKINDLKTPRDLMQKSFFPMEDMTIARNHLLSELVKLVNERIKLFYYYKKDRLESLMPIKQTEVENKK